MTTAHKHKAKTKRTIGWSYCVAPYDGCSGAAHGAVVHVETCACGAVRKTETNGRHTSQGEWAEPEGERGG